MVICCDTVPSCDPHDSICCTTSCPDVTTPNTVCFPSSQSVSAVVMKNCDEFVSGPAFAIDSRYGWSCSRVKFSSGNDSP